MNLTRPHQPQQLPEKLRQAGFLLVLFLCLFIPFRTPLSDLTVSAVKAIPDVLILCLAGWYAVAVKFRFRFTLHDLLFLAFLAVGLVSTVLVNGNGVGLVVYQTRSIGIYYILYFVIRNFGFGKGELVAVTRTLQLVSLPLFALAMIEKIFSKTILFNPAVSATLDKINFGRLYSMFYNPNTYGLFLVFVLVLSLAIWYLEDKKTPLWLYCTLCISLYMTMSRSAMMILAAVLAVLFLLAVRSKQIAIQWKKLVLWCLCMGASALVVSYAAGYVAQIYFDKVGKYNVVLTLSENQASAVTPVTYLNSQGEKCTGYTFYGITYTDKECTKPLDDYGSVVFVDNKQYVLTNEGGKLLEEFQALSEAEQSVLLDGAVVRDGAFRENTIINNIQDSFDVDTTDRFGDLQDEKMYSASTNGRLYSLVTAFTIAADHPIVGVGFGSYGSSASLTWVPEIYEDYEIRELFYADNQFACVLAETGFVGFALFMAFLLSTLWYHRKHLLKVIACVIIAWFGVFYNILEIQMGAMLLWTILALDLGKLTPKDLLGK